MAEKKFLDYDGLKEFLAKLEEKFGPYGALTFKGTVANVAGLPAVSGTTIGDMYTVLAAGKTTADFTDGAGKEVAANSEVAAVKVSGTTETTIFSKDDGTSYVTADLSSYVPAGTVGSGTKVCEVYVADGTETYLTEGHWYVTENGAAFYDATVLADDFADFTKESISNEDALAELGDKYTGGAFVDLNVYTETITQDAMKWCLIGPVFDVSNKLTFGKAMPSNPADGDDFLYLGDTTYTYDEVTPVGTENPKALGWYVSDGAGGYELTDDETVQPGTTYYTKNEEYVQGVIYEYDTTEGWQALNSGDTMVAITKAEVDALFE